MTMISKHDYTIFFGYLIILFFLYKLQMYGVINWKDKNPSVYQFPVSEDRQTARQQHMKLHLDRIMTGNCSDEMKNWCKVVI